MTGNNFLPAVTKSSATQWPNLQRHSRLCRGHVMSEKVLFYLFLSVDMKPKNRCWGWKNSNGNSALGGRGYIS